MTSALEMIRQLSCLAYVTSCFVSAAIVAVCVRVLASDIIIIIIIIVIIIFALQRGNAVSFHNTMVTQ